MPSWTASYELSTVVRALDKAVGVPRSTQVHCSGVDLTEARFPPVEVSNGLLRYMAGMCFQTEPLNATPSLFSGMSSEALS